MGELVHRLPDELSGGQRQRVAVARATVGERRVLLAADRPPAPSGYLVRRGLLG